MQLWVVLWASLVGVAVVVALTAIEIEFDARGFGDESGSWAAAFGIATLGVVVSGVCAKQQPARIDVMLFGKKVALRRWLRRDQKPKREVAERVPDSPNKKPRIGVTEAVELLLEESRRLKVDRVDAELQYGFRDIALTGHLAGLLYALSGALPPQVRLVQNVRWDGAERWEASAAGRLQVWAGRVLFDVLWYMLRSRRGAPGAGANALGKQSA